MPVSGRAYHVAGMDTVLSRVWGRAVGENARRLAAPEGKRSSFLLVYSLLEGVTKILVDTKTCQYKWPGSLPCKSHTSKVASWALQIKRFPSPHKQLLSEPYCCNGVSLSVLKPEQTRAKNSGPVKGPPHILGG